MNLEQIEKRGYEHFMLKKYSDNLMLLEILEVVY
jgi:hypothetical protein